MKKHSLPTTIELGLLLVLVILGITSRLLPHPPNVAAIGAMALFSGMYLSRRTALLAPLVAMFLSDIIIGFYHWQMMVAVYVSFLLSACIGYTLREKKNIPALIGGTFLSALLFFFVTNGAVWAFGTMYPRTMSGLLESYVAALPFFRNSILGDFFFIGVFLLCYTLALEIHKYFTTKKSSVLSQ